MTSRALRFKQIAISRLPGFGINAFPPIPEFRTGLNVVWGANSVGKSSLARAMKSLIWPRQDDIDAEAEADFDGQDWRFVRRGERLTHERLADASRSEDRWGPEENAARYWLPLHELLQVEREQDPFASYIQSRMRWGVDLAKANLEAGGKRARLTAARDEFKNLEKALGALTDLKKQQERQKDIPDRIEALTRLIDGASEASGRLKTLRREIEYRETEARIDALKLTMEAFPAGMDRIGAGDPERLVQLTDDAEEQLRMLENSERKAREKAAERAGLGLAPGFLDGEVQRIRLVAFLDRIQDTQAALAAAELERERERGAEAAWRQEHLWLFPEPPVTPILPAMVQKLKDLAGQCEPLRCQWDAASRRLEGLGGDDEAVPVAEEGLAELQTRVGDWLEADLAALMRDRVPRKTVRICLFGLAVLGLLGLGWLGFAPAGGTARAALGLMGLAAAALGLFLSRPGGGSTAAPSPALVQARTREILKGLPDLVPAAWTRASALTLSCHLARLQGQAQAARAGNAARKRARTAVQEARAAYGRWQEDLTAETRGLGLPVAEAALEGAQFFHFAMHLVKWAELKAQVAGAEAKCALWGNLVRDLRNGMRALLAANGCPEPSDQPGVLVAQGRDLLDRRARAVGLQREEAGLDQEIQDSRSRLAVLDAKIAGFWSNLGFDGPDPRRLSVLVDRLPDWQALQNDLALATRQLKSLLEGLLGHPPEGGLDDLNAEVTRLQGLMAATQDHLSERGGLWELHRQLLGGSALASAKLNLDEAGAALRRAKVENLVERMVDHLTTRLDQRSFQEDQPEVLQQASRRLLDFTEHRFWLGIDPRGRFFAHDTTKGRNFGLDELSSGTRVQLLFAVRLAFIEVLEGPGGARLPLFLDEVLGNSDDRRARAIVQVIMALARERQIFYFTAQNDEVSKLRDWAGPGNLHEIPLERLTRTQAGARAPLAVRLPAAEPVQELLEDYGAFGLALAVPGAKRYQEVETLHAWHALTRSRELHAFLGQGLGTLGQLALAVPPGQDPIGLLRRIAMLAKAHEWALVGRGRRFLPEDFARAPLAKGNAYWLEWQQLAKDADGDPVAFMDRAKDVKRVRKETLAEFSQWMLAEGFLASDPPLDRTAILYRLRLEFPWMEEGEDDLLVARRYLWAILPDTGGNLNRQVEVDEILK
jgi:hypothetical protein